MDKWLLPWIEIQSKTNNWFIIYQRKSFPDGVGIPCDVYTWGFARWLPAFDGWTYSISRLYPKAEAFPTAELAMEAADKLLIELGYILLTPEKLAKLELLL